jgi:hypothetical protein
MRTQAIDFVQVTTAGGSRVDAHRRSHAIAALR